jgi:PAP2 superfamily
LGGRDGSIPVRFDSVNGNVEKETTSLLGLEGFSPLNSRHPDHRPLKLWREIASIGAFYGLYTLVRNTQGNNSDATAQAFTNAKRVIRVERWTGTFHEESVQEFFLPFKRFIQTMNTYYGSFHFLVTIAALFWCFYKMPERYRFVRNGFATMTALALIGFKFFPLMPPRLLPETYGFVDTLKVYGGPWSFDSGPMAKVSNQFAAMPSLHFGWSAWCALVWWPWAKTWPRRFLLLGYPSLTMFAIVVTGNHYYTDAIGGAAALLAGLAIGDRLDFVAWSDAVRRRFTRQTGAKSTDG